jgi:hypothetical protein
VFSAVSLVGVDKAQAVRLTYSINDSDLSFFKVDNSSVTGIGYEEIAVSDGRFYGYTLSGGKEFHDLVGAARAVFVQGVFRGLSAGGSDQVIRFYTYDISGTSGYKLDNRIYWSMYVYPAGPNRWEPLLDSYHEEYTIFDSGYAVRSGTQGFNNQIPVSFTLVNTEPSPVPEPLTAGGTALALAGLSWLKHKKKMAA